MVQVLGPLSAREPQLGVLRSQSSLLQEFENTAAVTEDKPEQTGLLSTEGRHRRSGREEGRPVLQNPGPGGSCPGADSA